MKQFAPLLALAICSCATTVADLRSTAPFIRTSTGKSVQAYSACVADRWTARSGQVNTTPKENGAALTLSYPTYQGVINAATVDVEENGTNRSVTVYARSGDAGDKLRREIESCL